MANKKSGSTKKSKSTRAAKPTRTTKNTRPRATEQKTVLHHHTEVNQEKFAGTTVLTPQDAQPLMGTGSADTWDYQPDPQVNDMLLETEDIDTGSAELADTMRTDSSNSPILSGGDIDADWQDAQEDGEETVGGTTPTPDQSRVDELGQAVGLVYQDEEPLHTEDKLQARDRKRWELNPASTETEGKD